MGDSVLDKVKKFRESRPKGQNFKKQRDIFFKFEDGDNIIRLVGEFLEVKTHFISPNHQRGDRGLCISEAFKGEGRLPKMINCPNWDIENEKAKEEKTCPICKLWRVAKNALKEAGQEIEPQDKQFLENLVSDASVTTALKWNVIDRRSPNVTEVDDAGVEKQVLGYKVANIGMEAWNDVDGIFKQLKVDISDAKEGVDINIIKGHNGARVCYSAVAVTQGMSVKQTPLTDEEKKMTLHDLRRIAGRMVEPQKIVDGLHDDLREILESAEGETTPSSEEAPASESAVTSEPESQEESTPEEEKEKPEKKRMPPLSEGFGDDFSDDKEKDKEKPTWDCFGTVDDPSHDECAKCDSLADCIIEAKKRASKE